MRFHAWYDDGTSRVDNLSLFSGKNGKLVKKAVSQGYSDDSRLAGPSLKRVFYSRGPLFLQFPHRPEQNKKTCVFCVFLRFQEVGGDQDDPVFRRFRRHPHSFDDFWSPKNKKNAEMRN